jgi:predicted ATPase
MVAVLDEFNLDHTGQIPHPLALHFGINTGLVITGGIGTRQRQDYSVMGDTVNLAARLEDLSEAGQVLVGEGTYRVTAPLFEFEALRPVRVKGKAQPVRVYRLLRAKATLGGQIRGIEGLNSPLVGRAEELVSLDEHLTGVCHGRGGVVSVVGEVGLGKSRLVAESCLSCHIEGEADWFEGQAVSYGENAGYLVARAVLRNMLGLDPEASSAEVELALRAELERYVPDRIGDIYPYLAHVLDIHLDAEANQRIKYLEGEALSQQISESVHSYVLARTKKSPLILVWEDLHWADPSSLGLLEALLPATQVCALLLILVYRPRLYSQAWAFQQRVSEIMADDHKVIKLAPLTPQQSGQLLDNLLGSGALPETVRALIVSKAEGNPFYLEEVIRSLINSKAIARAPDNHGWLTTPGLSEIRLPNTLQGVIMARIDKLEPETKRVLQIASVVGRNFPYKVLEQVVRQMAGVS